MKEESGGPLGLTFDSLTKSDLPSGFDLSKLLLRKYHGSKAKCEH